MRKLRGFRIDHDPKTIRYDMAAQSVRNLFKRYLTALRCRWQGHQLHFVRTTSHNERLFYCHCCKQRFTLCRQGWHRYSDVAPHHGH